MAQILRHFEPETYNTEEFVELGDIYTLSDDSFSIDPSFIVKDNYGKSYNPAPSKVDIRKYYPENIKAAEFNKSNIILVDFSRPSNKDIGPLLKRIDAQIEELRQEAIEEQEKFNENSADFLRSFCFDLLPDFEPAIFRLPNGNLRAVWQGKAKDQIAIQFLDNKKLQHVVINHPNGDLEKDLGEHTNSSIVHAVVDGMNLMHLWFRG